jgi:hypothetical protein
VGRRRIHCTLDLILDDVAIDCLCRAADLVLILSLAPPILNSVISSQHGNDLRLNRELTKMLEIDGDLSTPWNAY